MKTITLILASASALFLSSCACTKGGSCCGSSTCKTGACSSTAKKACGGTCGGTAKKASDCSSCSSDTKKKI